MLVRNLVAMLIVAGVAGGCGSGDPSDNLPPSKAATPESAKESEKKIEEMKKQMMQGGGYKGAPGVPKSAGAGS